MSEFTPENFRYDDFEQRVDALQSALGKSFSFDTNKRGKLRDVMAAVLFDAEDGYQEISDKLVKSAPVSNAALAPPRHDFDLPDTLYLMGDTNWFTVEIYSKAGFGPNGSMGEMLYRIAQDYLPSHESPNVYEPWIYNKPTGECRLESSDLLRYISKHYHAVKYEVETSSIVGRQGYGTKRSEGVKLIESIFIDAESIKDTSSPFLTFRRRDEGPTQVIIKLERKTAHAIHHVFHEGIANNLSGRIEMLLLPIYASKIFEILTANEKGVRRMIPDLTQVPIQGAFKQFTRPLTVNGRIVGYARADEGHVLFAKAMNKLTHAEMTAFTKPLIN